MADLDFVKVVGRLGLTVGDGVDPDQNPDVVWCDSGEVWFTPLNQITKVVGALPVPATLGQSVVKVPVDSDGYLSYGETRMVYLVDLTSEKVNPRIGASKATHKVEFKNVKSAGVTVPFQAFTARLASDTLTGGACDITLLSPANPGGGTPIVTGPAGKSVESLRTVGGDLLYTVDGVEQVAGPLPVGPGGTDAGVASYLDDPESLTASRLAATVASARVPATITYANGLPNTETIPLATGGNLVKTYAWDANGNPVSAAWNYPTGPDYLETFTYDAAGNATGSTFTGA